MSQLIQLNFGPLLIPDQESKGNSSMKLLDLFIEQSRSSSRPRIWIVLVFGIFLPFNIVLKIVIFLQFEYFDFLDRNLTFGPIFNRDEFLVPLLKLQDQIMNLEVNFNDTIITLKDVCNNPLSRPDKDNGICNIQSIWSYWQDSLDNLDLITEGFLGKKNLTYLDHFLKCARCMAFLNPTANKQNVCSAVLNLSTIKSKIIYEIFSMMFFLVAIQLQLQKSLVIN